MAIESSKSTPKTQQNQTDNTVKQTFEFQQPNAISDNPFGFMGVSLSPGRLACSPLRGEMGTESYVKLAEQVKEIVKTHNKNPNVEIKVLELDRSVDPNLLFSSFVFVAQSAKNPELGVGYSVVLMESTGDQLKAKIEVIHGETVEIPQFTEVAADKYIVRAAESLIRTNYGNVKTFVSDTQVIPADFNHENKEAVRGLAVNASMAASSALVMFGADGAFFTDLDLVKELKQLKTNDGSADLSFVYNFHPQVVEDNLKLPTRASVVIQTVTGWKKTGVQESVHSGSGPKTLSETCGFVDLMPVSPKVIQFNQYQQQAPRLAPVFVITKPTSNFSYTPGGMLTNILVSTDLNKDYGWVSAFANKTPQKNNSLDLTDVTAITIDIPSKTNPGQSEDRPPVPSTGISMDILTQFLGTYCAKDLTIAIDVPIASPSSWYLSIFVQAALGKPGAINTLNKRMELLTGGHFSKYVTNDVPIFAWQPVILERGYWESGTRRPIEDVDYVAVCNFADATNNPQIVERWTNTFLQTSRNQAARLQERRNIIQEVTGHTATFIGRSVRCFFNGKWLAAGVNALATAGITTSSEGRGNFGFDGGRGYAEFLTGSALPSNAAWGSAFGNKQGGYNYGAMNSTPWGNI